ncbi:hypothetical protein CcaCcLH18_09810 [Colletotrichum camelliae]|nr:hypothetical protein CcaCcLH18_09810 [Colletotrichum camelliae]
MNLVQSNSDHISAGTEGDEPSTALHFSLKNPGEYVAAFNEKTEATIKAFTNDPLAPMYRQPDQGAATSLDLEVTRAELHAMIFPRILGGLDFVAVLKPFKVPTLPGAPGQDGEDADLQPDLKLTVVIHYVKSVDITGGSGGIYVHQAFTLIVNYSVNPQQWASALQKSNCSSSSEQVIVSGATSGAAGQGRAVAGSSVDTGIVTSKLGALSRGWFGGKPKPGERIKFTLRTTVLELELDDAKYHANKAKFENILKNLTEGDERLGPIAESNGLDTLGRSTCTIYHAVKAWFGCARSFWGSVLS